MTKVKKWFQRNRCEYVPPILEVQLSRGGYGKMGVRKEGCLTFCWNQYSFGSPGGGGRGKGNPRL